MAIYRRRGKDGREYGKFIMRFQHLGHTVHKTTGTMNHLEAVAKEIEAKQAIERAILGETEPTKAADKATEITTLREAIEALYKLRWSHTATGERTRDMVLMLDEIMGHPKIVDISDELVGQVIEHLQTVPSKRGMLRSSSSINRYLMPLRTVLSHGERYWGFPRTPYIPRLKEQEIERHIISDDEFNRMIDYMNTTMAPTRLQQLRQVHCMDVFRLMLDCGFRTAEVLALDTSKHIDLSAKEVYLTPDITKTDKGRVVPLSDDAVALIKRRIITGNAPLLFSGLKAYHTNECFNRVRKALGMKVGREYVPYSLRHTAATHFVEASDLSTAQRILGHTDIKTTLKYVKTNRKALHKAMDRKQKRGLNE